MLEVIELEGQQKENAGQPEREMKKRVSACDHQPASVHSL
jgi:hypothetical protein